MKAVYNGAEGETILPRRRHVGDTNIVIAIALHFAPLLQCFYFRCHLNSVLQQQVHAL